VLLPESEKTACEDYDENDESVDRIMQKKGHPGGKQENEDERTLELRQQKRKNIRPLLGLQEIGAIAVEPPAGFLAAQSFPGRAELLEHLGRRYAPEGQGELIHADG